METYRPTTPHAATAGRRFRVIVVGGGIAGLTASHCLQKADVDHVLLERRTEIDPPEGASYAVYPHGARILDQIGCLDAAEAACQPCQHYYSRGASGETLSDNGYFNHARRNHGQDILLLERRRLLRILYDGLPDKTPVRMGCGVSGIAQDADGVTVTLADGTTERGDVVLGCDGVYSRVREAMWTHAAARLPGPELAAERRRLETRWKCLVGTGPPEPGLGARDMTSTATADGVSFLALTQPDRAFWFVFCQLDAPVVWPQQVRYGPQEAEALARQLAARPVSPSVPFGRLWARRDRAVLIPLQEGVLRHWASGRIVLAGDAAHKMTPNLGLGGNTAMESVAVLCNHLVRARDEAGVAKAGRPSAAALERCFQAYQVEHHARVASLVQLSRVVSRVQACDTRFTRWLAEWVMPALPDRALAYAVGRLVRAAPALAYVPLENEKFARGAMAWRYEPPTGPGPARRAVVLGAVLLALVVLAVYHYGQGAFFRAS